MRLAVRSIAAFNTATAVWLTVMFLILRHADYARNAAVTAGVAAFCLWSVWAAREGTAAWQRHTMAVGSVVMAGYGAWAIYGDLRPGANFEGFVLIIGAAWVVQGALALLAYASAGAAPAAGPSA